MQTIRQSLFFLASVVLLVMLVLPDSAAAAPHHQHQHQHHEHRHHPKGYNSAFRDENVASFVRDREHLPEHRPLCQSTSTRIDLNETGFEFRPPFYYSEVCTSAALHQHQRYGGSSTSQHSCSTYGLSCVQRYRTVMIAKRIKGSSCWTTLTRNIPSGCECMQPVNDYSDLRHRSS